MIQALLFYLRLELGDELYNINTRLRVSPDIEMKLQADKEFSLCVNYPNGHNELFSKWINHNHPGALLLHIDRTSGSRKSLCVEEADTVYWYMKYGLNSLIYS